MRLFILLTAGLLLPSTVQAQLTSKAVKETAEYVFSRFGSKAAGESVEVVGKKIGAAVTKYGDEILPAFKKVGPPAFKAAEEVAEIAGPKLKLMARNGDDALWVTGDSRRMAIFMKSGDDAADAMLKHKGIAEDLLEKFGTSSAKPLARLGDQGANRLAMLNASGELAKMGRTDEVLGVLGKYGDPAMDFIWRNKGALLTVSVLANFLLNPEPYITGVAHLAGTIADPITKNTNWTLVISLLVTFGFIVVLLRWFLFKPGQILVGVADKGPVGNKRT